MRTRLGITVGLLGAGIYFTALFGNVIALVLIAGYALLFEQNEWLRRTALKAVIVLFLFAFIKSVIGFVPDILSWIGSVVNLFEGEFKYELVTNIMTIINKSIDLIEKVLFILLGLTAFNQGTIVVPGVDSMINKYTQ